MKTHFAVIPVFCLMSAVAVAVDIPGVSPADFNPGPEAHWIWALLGSGAFAAIVAALAKIVQSLIGNIKDARLARACDFVYAGTMTCFQEYVRATKAASADGRLTLDEKNEALRYAYGKAVEIARTEGFDLLKVLGKEMILALIEKYVGQAKSAALRTVAAPLSDLRPLVPVPPLPDSAS